MYVYMHVGIIGQYRKQQMLIVFQFIYYYIHPYIYTYTYIKKAFTYILIVNDKFC